MYNPLLDAFVAVADCGSFNKAAEKLFVSPTAVMKKMNSLESHLGMKLVNRASSGIELTPCGRRVYQDARFIMDYSSKSIAVARKLDSSFESTFCVGTSLLNPAKPFMDLWYKVNAEFADYKLHLVPFEDDQNGILSEISQLGEKFDFLIGVCDSKTWLSLANYLPVGRYRKMVAVRRGHPLAAKEKLDIEDLHGCTLMMVRKGDSGVNDFIRNDLTLHHPAIAIEDTQQFYDISVFNRCAETDNVLLTIECWQDVHPGLVTIPVDWDYSIPYGILYSLDPPKDVVELVETIETRLAGQHGEPYSS